MLNKEWFCIFSMVFCHVFGSNEGIYMCIHDEIWSVLYEYTSIYWIIETRIGDFIYQWHRNRNWNWKCICKNILESKFLFQRWVWSILKYSVWQKSKSRKILTSTEADFVWSWIICFYRLTQQHDFAMRTGSVCAKQVRSFICRITNT